MKKKALGRGLSALFEPENNTDNKVVSETAEKVQVPDKASKSEAPDKSSKIQAPDKSSKSEVPDKSRSEDYRLLNIESIQASPEQPRSHFDRDKLQELADSIKNFGIIEPIIVNPLATTPETYELIAGERRLRASKLAGLTEIPAIIKTNNNNDLLEMMLIENLQREDLTPMEEAQSFETLINKKKLTQDKLAELIGKSRSYITNMLRILKAPLSVKEHLAENRLSFSQVRTLITLPELVMIDLANRAVKGNLSVRELEKLVNRYHHPPQRTKSSQTIQKDPNIAEIEQMYRDRLKTKVTIHFMKNKMGKIEIEYYNYDELLEILGKIKQ